MRGFGNRVDRPAGAHGPQPAGFIATDRRHFFPRGGRAKGDIFKAAVLVTRDHAGFVSNPERPLGIFKETGDAPVLESRCIGGVEYLKVFPVKTGQSILGTGPEKTIVRLGN